jgi:hypothetical protein
MSVLLAMLLVFALLVVMLAVPVAIRDRRRASDGYSGRHGRPVDGMPSGHLDGVSTFGGGGFGGGFDGGFDGGGCGGGDGGGGC